MSDGRHLSPYPVYKSMTDKRIRQILIDLGYLFPETDDEISRSIEQAKRVKIPKHLDNPLLFLKCSKQPEPLPDKNPTDDCKRE